MSNCTIEFKQDSFLDDVLNSDKPVLVDFWAEWCGPCNTLTPTINEIADEYKGIAVIGKLNVAKGYDLFGSSIINILNKHKDWKAIVIGDEPREKINFIHKNLKILGFKSHKYILNILKKVSIAVVCSRWEAPFGRASLEACSRGCATIISNKGGLPETTRHPVIIEE